MKLLKRLVLLIVLVFIAGSIYTSCLIGVNPVSKQYLDSLSSELKSKGYDDAYFVLSGKRWAWHNAFLVKFGGAASKSRHLKGEAIDIIILDVNDDGKRDAKDVDIVYDILNTKIIRSKGGIGT